MSPRLFADVLHHSTQLVHLELDVLGDVDEGLVDDLVKVDKAFGRSVVRIHAFFELIVSHRVGLAARGLTLVLEHTPDQVAIRRAQLSTQGILQS